MKQSWPIFMPGHSLIGSVATLESSRVTWPSKPGSTKPAVEWISRPSRPRLDFPSSRATRSSGRRTRSSVDPSTNSPGCRMNGSCSSISTSSVRSCSFLTSMNDARLLRKTRKRRSTRTSTLDGCSSDESYGSISIRPSSSRRWIVLSERTMRRFYGVDAGGFRVAGWCAAVNVLSNPFQLTPRTPQPTLTTVAQLANVSVASASRALNGIRTTPDVLTKVTEAAEAVGYVPNAAARSLRSRRTGQVAFAMPDVANPVYTTMVSSIQEVARAAGWRLMLHSTNADIDDELAIVRDLKQRFVDGLILCSLR